MYYKYKNDYFYYNKKKYDSGTLIVFSGNVKTKDGCHTRLEKRTLEFIYEDNNGMLFKDVDSGKEYIYDDGFYFNWCVNEILWDKTMYQHLVTPEESKISEEGCNNIILGIVLMVFGLVFYDWWLIWIMVTVWLYFSVIKGGK